MSYEISHLLQSSKQHFEKSLHYLENEVISNFLFMQQCLFCSARSTTHFPVCIDCHNDLLAKMNMSTDAIPLVSLKGMSSTPPFDRLITFFEYEFPIDKMILALKFNHALINAHFLGNVMAEQLFEYYSEHPLPDCLIPMPLHIKRVRERGFNQAIELAQPIAKKLSLPLERFAVSRVKHTQAQSSMQASKSSKERKKNIRKAFQCNKSLPQHVAIVDDVITTGHTMVELCRTIKKQGVKRIDVWCCARTLLK